MAKPRERVVLSRPSSVRRDLVDGHQPRRPSAKGSKMRAAAQQLFASRSHRGIATSQGRCLRSSLHGGTSPGGPEGEQECSQAWGPYGGSDRAAPIGYSADPDSEAAGVGTRCWPPEPVQQAICAIEKCVSLATHFSKRRGGLEIAPVCHRPALFSTQLLGISTQLLVSRHSCTVSESGERTAG